jgi:predicted DNA-binding protein
MAKVKLCITLPPELKEKVDKRAEQEGRTLTELLSTVVNEYIKRRQNGS